VSLISTETKEDGTILYEIRGLMFECFLLSIKKMYTTVVFLQPSLKISFQAGMTDATKITAGIADVLVGVVPLVSLVVSGMTVISTPFIFQPGFIFL
jgi:hypothetical protein